MPHLSKEEIVEMVERVMLAAMDGDRETTNALMAPDVEIHFAGGQRLREPAEIKAVNANRYRTVKKDIERWDVAYEGDAIIAYSIGTLYGEWFDGTPFEGDRYIDRFVIKGGKIVRMDVWNDSAERLLLKRTA